MRWISTRGDAPPADLRSAVLWGLAPDGGLYVPERLDPLPEGALEALRGAPFPDVARLVARHLLKDALPEAALDAVVDDALDFPVPLMPLEGDRRLLELFHGPTLAFKDVGARFMARLVGHWREAERPTGSPLTVLAATSGDTGSAVAHAFLGVPGVRTVVLFPEGQVSPLQERQFTTLAGNVDALAVRGTFDDCQRMVKAAFTDAHLREARRLTSANSINPGRLVPQVFYYAHAWLQLPEGAPPPVFSTPSGNFGNLAAGLMARRIGVPAAGFVAATNANDVVPAYLEGAPFTPRPSRRTLSSAMDVGDPSNFDRILHLYGEDREALRRHVVGSAHSDDDTRTRIAGTYARTGRVVDPHTAVGLLGLERGMAEWPGRPGIALATAHPAKFREVVEPAIGRTVALPEALEACLRRDRRVTPLEPRDEALRDWLLEG